jgi:cobalt-zinc-cadmium efflux system outer membrane protein
MKASNCLLFLCGIGLISTGCAVRRYRLAPISPQQAAVEYEARNLNNPGLRVFIEKNLGRQLESWPPKTWDPAMLTLAALHYHSDLAIARAGINVAEAGVITAGARPNPSIRIAPGVTDSPESPWLFSITPTFPIETAGKRGYRIQMAKRVTEAARLQLAETAWQIRARLRATLLDFLLAKENLILLRQEEQVGPRS